MAAFRFLALITVGFSLLALIFLLHVHQARLEREMTREILGPEIALTEGATATWQLDFGGLRIEEAWPGEQRQPHFFVRGAEGARVEIRARYMDLRDPDAPKVALDQALIEDDAFGTAADGDLTYGPMWLSWVHPLEITATVTSAPAEGAPSGAQLVVHGYPSRNFVGARSVARTLWAVFAVIAAAGFAGLMLTFIIPPPAEEEGAGAA